MDDRATILRNFLNKSFKNEQKGTFSSISDLREKEFSGEPLSEQESMALRMYDSYRIWYLESAASEEEFHQRYGELREKENLLPYSDFLNMKFTESHS